MLQIKATFDIFGFRTREYDLTPAIGLALIAVTIFLVGKTTMGA
jgi:hypothetical protein